jgi:hypothetical protein
MALRRGTQSCADDFATLSRSLLALKRKVAAVRSCPSSKAAREAEKASDHLESLLPPLEDGLPGVQLVAHQVSGSLSCPTVCPCSIFS